jgi:hypothetical protein
MQCNTDMHISGYELLADGSFKLEILQPESEPHTLERSWGPSSNFSDVLIASSAGLGGKLWHNIHEASTNKRKMPCHNRQCKRPGPAHGASASLPANCACSLLLSSVCNTLCLHFNTRVHTRQLQDTALRKHMIRRSPNQCRRLAAAGQVASLGHWPAPYSLARKRPTPRYSARRRRAFSSWPPSARRLPPRRLWPGEGQLPPAALRLPAAQLPACQKLQEGRAPQPPPIPRHPWALAQLPANWQLPRSGTVQLSVPPCRRWAAQVPAER